jgi:hypothetical protein
MEVKEDPLWLSWLKATAAALFFYLLADYTYDRWEAEFFKITDSAYWLNLILFIFSVSQIALFTYALFKYFIIIKYLGKGGRSMKNTKVKSIFMLILDIAYYLIYVGMSIIGLIIVISCIASVGMSDRPWIDIIGIIALFGLGIGAIWKIFQAVMNFRKEILVNISNSLNEIREDITK